MYLPNLKYVALPVHELIGGSQKIGAVPGYAHTLNPLPPKILYAYHTDYLCALVFPRFSIAVLSGVANPQSWGRGGRRSARLWYRSKERW